MEVTIRLENEKDYKIVENLVREAFWNVYKPGASEHLVVHKLREQREFVKELDFVASIGEEIIGSIMCLKGRVINKKGDELEVLSIAEVAVLPKYQGNNISTILVNKCLEEAKKLGYKAIVLFGEPWFYHRFSFVNAEKYNIKTELGINLEEFMALELYEGALKEVNGRFYESSVFNIDKEELKEFDLQFAYKEKYEE